MKGEDTLYDQVHAEAMHDYDPLSLDHDYREAEEERRQTELAPLRPLAPEVAAALDEIMEDFETFKVARRYIGPGDWCYHIEAGCIEFCQDGCQMKKAARGQT